MPENIGTIVKFGRYDRGILIEELIGVVWLSAPTGICVKCEDGSEYSLLGGQYEVIQSPDESPVSSEREKSGTEDEVNGQQTEKICAVCIGNAEAYICPDCIKAIRKEAGF